MKGAMLLAAALAGLLFGCGNAEESFANGRVEQLCNASVPVCASSASCVMGEKDLIRGEFPGGQRLVIRTEQKRATLVVRVLLVDPSFPGTEYLVRGYDTGCGGFDELHITERDLFEYAGDDNVIEYSLELKGRGDHMLELYSDMSSGFLLTIAEEPRRQP